MKHESPRNPPPSPAAPPAPARDRAQWTPAKQRIFLSALLATGSVVAAARAAGMSRSSAHRLRQRLAGTVFDRTWAEALRLHAAHLADPFGARQPAAPPTPERPAPVANRSSR